MAINTQSRADVNALLAQVPSLTVEDFAIINDTARKMFSIRDPARDLMKLSAADLSWLEKWVRDSIGMFLGSVDWPLGLV